MENTLFIVDDHSIVRFGLKDWLEGNTKWKVAKVFGKSQECLEELERLDSVYYPEIIIIDVQLFGETGFALCKKITEKYDRIKCVMYSMYDTPGYILQAKDSGAKGYVSKISSERELEKCLDVVKAGGIYLEEKMIQAQAKLENVAVILSKQERLIFELLLQSKTNEQISDELFISLRTVENHVSRIYDKLDIKKRADLLEKFGKYSE